MRRCRPHLLTSAYNPRVKDVARLRNRRHRQREKRFVVEGMRELAAAAEAAFPVRTLYFCTDFHAARGEAELVQRFARAGAACEETNAAVFKKMSYRRTPDGLLGVAEAPSLASDALPPGELRRTRFGWSPSAWRSRAISVPCCAASMPWAAMGCWWRMA